MVTLLGLFLCQGCGGSAPAVLPSLTSALELATPSMTTQPSSISSPPLATMTSTPDDIATFKAIQKASIQTLVSTVQPVVLSEYPSQDGKWRVEVIRYECVNYSPEEIVAYEQLKLIDLSDGSEQVVADQGQSCGGLGALGFEGLFWSPSQRYFYYTDWREGFPETCGNYIAPTLYRLDTSTGETIMVGGGHLSPDQTKLAMWDWPENEIVIWDLDQGEVGRVTPFKSELYRGGITWSWDSQSLRYIQTELECAPDYGKTYIAYLDLRDYSQRLLAEYPGPDRKPVSTPTPVPLGMFALLLYPPLVMDYDPSIWQDETQYADIVSMSLYSITKYLQARSLETCTIGQGAPLGEIPATAETSQLSPVRYKVFSGTNSPDTVIAYYVENQSLTGFDYVQGAPLLTVQASPAEWERCRALAEKVLATLRVP